MQDLVDIFDHINKLYGVSYDKVHESVYRRYGESHELLSSWDPADFECTTERTRPFAHSDCAPQAKWLTAFSIRSQMEREYQKSLGKAWPNLLIRLVQTITWCVESQAHFE